MKKQLAGFTTRELSKKTWPDFVRFFSQGNGWDHCGCTAYQGFRAPQRVRKWADKRDWNLNVKCDLVERGRAHGILVYAGTEPIGWCQFGPSGELPIRDDRRRSKLFPDGDRVWKITCFCTHKDYSRQGVAGIALRASLEAIRLKGGGLVEAYPIAHPQEDPETDERLARIKEWEKTMTRLIRTHGRFSEEVERHLPTREPVVEVVEGVGRVNASYRPIHCGTSAMFEREGFTAIAVLPESTRLRVPGPRPTRVVMQKRLRPAKRN